MTEFIECGSVSVSYDATGKATVSYTKIKEGSGAPSTPNSLYFGGVSFTGNTMSIMPSPILGNGSWFQWQVGWQGVGN